MTTDETKPLTFDDCCRAVMKAADEAKPGAAITWAYGYARSGIGMTGDARSVQALYILNNIASWRGDEAKRVRAALKRFSKEG